MRSKRPVLQVIDGGHRPLTGRQEKFARLLAQDALSKSEAYRGSYTTSGMSQRAIWTEAWRLSRHPQVVQRVAELEAERDRVAWHDAAQTRQYVLGQLRHEALTAANDGVRLRALELLGKSIGLFGERREVETAGTRTAAELQAELRDQLSRLLE